MLESVPLDCFQPEREQARDRVKEAENCVPPMNSRGDLKVPGKITWKNK